MTSLALLADSQDIAHMICDLHPHRSLSLLREFLPRGYEMTSLNCGRKGNVNLAAEAKWHLGALITFQDDLADHPKFYDPTALDYLASRRTERPEQENSLKAVALSEYIANRFWDAVDDLPYADFYRPLLIFDVDQFFNANRLSALLRAYPGLGCDYESRLFGPFNMGMVAAGTIDLMTLGPLSGAELALVREATYLGQRAGRISNIMSTHARELEEGDVTNELDHACVERGYKMHALSSRENERIRMIEKIRALAKECHSVNLEVYASGIERFHELHQEFAGRI